MDLFDVSAYLKGYVSFLTDDAVNSICFNRKVDPSIEACEVSKRNLQLCLADAYMWASRTPSSSASVKDADGNWSHEEGSLSVSAGDKTRFVAEAKRLYALYGERIGGAVFKFKSSGIRLCPTRK